MPAGLRLPRGAALDPGVPGAPRGRRINAKRVYRLWRLAGLLDEEWEEVGADATTGEFLHGGRVVPLRERLRGRPKS